MANESKPVGYGQNAYYDLVLEVLGEDYKDKVQSVWGSVEHVRDVKITNLLLMELIKMLRRKEVKAVEVKPEQEAKTTVPPPVVKATPGIFKK